MLPVATSELSSIDHDFGKAVVYFREAQGWSQKVFAEKLAANGLKIDATAVSKIENGFRVIRLADADIIARTLGLEVASMLSFSGRNIETVSSQQFEVVRAAKDLGPRIANLLKELDQLAYLDLVTEYGLGPDELFSEEADTRASQTLAWSFEAAVKVLEASGETALPAYVATDARRKALLGFVSSLASRYCVIEPLLTNDD